MPEKKPLQDGGFSYEEEFPITGDPELAAALVRMAAKVVAGPHGGRYDCIIFKCEGRKGVVDHVDTAACKAFLEEMEHLPEIPHALVKLARIEKPRLVKLSPEEHFFVLQSFVAAVAKVGFRTLIGAWLENPHLPFGSNQVMQAEMIRALREAVPKAANYFLADVVLDFLEDAPPGWIAKNWERLVRTWGSFAPILKANDKLAERVLKEIPGQGNLLDVLLHILKDRHFWSPSKRTMSMERIVGPYLLDLPMLYPLLLQERRDADPGLLADSVVFRSPRLDAYDPRTPADALAELARSEDEITRQFALGNPSIESEVLERAVFEGPSVDRLAVLSNPRISEHVFEVFVEACRSVDEAKAAAAHPALTRSAADALLSRFGDDQGVLLQLAGNPRCPEPILVNLASYASKEVAGTAALNLCFFRTNFEFIDEHPPRSRIFFIGPDSSEIAPRMAGAYLHWKDRVACYPFKINKKITATSFKLHPIGLTSIVSQTPTVVYAHLLKLSNPYSLSYYYFVFKLARPPVRPAVGFMYLLEGPEEPGRAVDTTDFLLAARQLGFASCVEFKVRMEKYFGPLPKDYQVGKIENGAILCRDASFRAAASKFGFSTCSPLPFFESFLSSKNLEAGLGRPY
ncbi:MAG: hypothetical protein Kow0069_35170 [Promethearchaeota archaeon]